jgi:hypothetical protein
MPNIKDQWFSSTGGLEQGRLERMFAKADAAIASLEAVSSTKAIWDARTAAQRQEDTRLTVVAVTKIARLLLGRLEAE